MTQRLHELCLYMNSIQKNQFKKLAYHGARKVLLTNFIFRAVSEGPKVPKQIQTWRARRFDKYRFREQAAIFCYGLRSLAPRCSWAIAMWPEVQSDIDCVFRCRCPWDKEEKYKTVQLKELVPDDVNPIASLQDILDELDKYADDSDLAVGIYLNRDVEVHFGTLRLPKKFIGQIWLFGQDQLPGTYFLLGDLMRQWRRSQFSHPRFAPNESVTTWKSAEDDENL